MAFLTVNTVYARFCFIAFTAVVSMAVSAAEAPVAANPVNPTPSVVEPTEENVEITCEYGCEKYSEGTLTCMYKAQYRCGKMGWQKTGQQDETCQPKPAPSPVN